MKKNSKKEQFWNDTYDIINLYDKCIHLFKICKIYLYPSKNRYYFDSFFLNKKCITLIYNPKCIIVVA